MAPADSLTPAEWRQRLDTERVAALDADSAAWGDLRRSFNKFTVRTRAASRTEWITELPQLTLQQKFHSSLQLSQLLAAEFQRPDHASAAIVQELLTENDRLLTVIEQQLTLCDLVHEAAEELHPLVDRLVHGGEVSARRLLNLAEELTSSLKTSQLTPAIVPLDPLLLEQTLQSAGWERGNWFAQALLSARLAAGYVQRVADLDASVARLVTAAALVQDIGAWHRPEAIRPRRDEPEQVSRGGRRRADPNHPGAGAAILTGLSDVPSRLCLLVSEHHERIDGTGFPRRLSGFRLAGEAQWLGLVIRLVELTTDPLSGDLADEFGDTLLEMSALRLWREVQRGSFLESHASSLLEALRPDLVETVARRHAERQRRQVDTRHWGVSPSGWPRDQHPREDRLRTDHGTDGRSVAAPVYVRRQRDGQRRGVLIPRQDSNKE